VNQKWPILPDGSVDWQTVFMHPEVGFMTTVEKADTPEKLKACMHIVVVSLFSRDNDADVRRQFMASIDELFSGKATTLQAKKAKINLLLSRIMYDREERAHKYKQMQANKKEDQPDQRLEEDDPLLALSEITDETYL
jgi:hypothetical protein